MLIKEEYIARLRLGEKEALEEVYNVYNPLYCFYIKYLVRNDEWVDSLVASFYNDLYNKINELKDNYNFEMWSLMLIKKSVRNFFKANERFSNLSSSDIEEILSIEYPFNKYDENLENIEYVVTILSYIYGISNSVIGRLMDKEDSHIASIKRKTKKILQEEYNDEWISIIKNNFINLNNNYSFNKVSSNIEFISKKGSSDTKIQGTLKSLLIFFLIIVVIVIIYAVVSKTGACDSKDSENITTTASLLRGLL